MSIVTYKDYQGEVEFSGGRLLIRVLHVQDFLTAECDSASEVETTFRQLIDDYLEDCRFLGREPAKPYSGKFNVRIDPALHRRAAMVAAQEEESLNSFVARAIETAVIEREQPTATARDSVTMARAIVNELAAIESTHVIFSVEQGSTSRAHHERSTVLRDEIQIAALKSLADQNHKNKNRRNRVVN